MTSAQDKALRSALRQVRGARRRLAHYLNSVPMEGHDALFYSCSRGRHHLNELDHAILAVLRLRRELEG